MTTTLSTSKARLAITMGDPCGVGPELIVKVFQNASVFGDSIPVVIGDPLALQRAIDLLGANLSTVRLQHPAELDKANQAGVVPLIAPDELSLEDIPYGHPSQRTCQAVIAFIEKAVQCALAGQVDAVCTCPINKAQLHRHGFDFPGHTEFLQHLTQTPNVVMMLAGPTLRVSLATIHHALAEVPGLLTREQLRQTITITGEALQRDFGLRAPHLAVAALNPHAGEEGRFGTEDRDLIGPVIDEFESRSYRVSGPYSADTLFYRAHTGEFDAVVALYHDQGLIPIKLIHFHEAVNITLGLPIIRTSVDHGTAYGLAGTGEAHPGSLEAAIRMAVFMTGNRSRFDAGMPDSSS